MTGLLALALLLAFGCADTPEDPDSNLVPDTFISSYSINTVPDSPADTTWWQDGVPHDTLTTAPDSVIFRTSLYMVTVYWRGSDMDGEPAGYRYWVDNGDPVEISDTEVSVLLSFPNTTTTYTFYVQSKDNSNEWDETPASKVLDITEIRDVTDPAFLPNTIGVTVPPNGASTSRGVPFAIGGTDVDGIVTTFEWAVDNTDTWTSVTPDVITSSSSAAEITLGPSDLALGVHIIYFRATDNMGNVDPSPVSVAIICEAGYAPELALSVSDGQIFIVPYTAPTIEGFTVNVTATVDFYYGQVDSFVVSTSEGASFTTTETEILLGDLSSGDYWVDITAWDAAENSTATGQVNFTISELGPDNGILCVNGIDWGTYGAEAVDVWEAGVAWGNRTHFKTWDLFDTSPIYSGSDFGDSLLGMGALPAWMLDTDFFEAISWFGNSYTGDELLWLDVDADLIAYLEMGGNILLPTRYGENFFFDDLATYAHVSSWTNGVTIYDLVAQHDSLTDITSAGASYADIPTTDGDASVTVLYEESSYPGEHAGFIVMPNDAGGGGAFCFIAGRNYRLDATELKANIDVILRYFFGVQ